MDEEGPVVEVSEEVASPDEEMDKEALETENAEVCFQECEEECCEDEEEVTDEEIEECEGQYQLLYADGPA